MRLLAAIATLLLAGLAVTTALAGDREIAALRAVFAPGAIDLNLFAPSFLAAVPPAQITAAVEPLKATIGPVTDIEPRGGRTYAVETQTHEMLADIVLDADGKIINLLVQPPVYRRASLDDLLSGLAAVAPDLAYLVTRDGAPLYSRDPDRAMAAGSAFKLGVLKALKDDIDAGRRRWDDVATLEAGDLSLPSGFLQTWPVGSPLTLHSLAALMISVSDNTAADLLLRLVGRDRVEAALGIAPVLSTRELFTLKANAPLKQRYLSADLAGKRDVLAEADRLPLPDVADVATPHDPGVEYDLSPARLCALMGEVAALDVTRINPGVARRGDWASVSFKGGSEIGVISLTTAATARDGATYCVSVVWNSSEAIDEAKATTAYAGVLARLAGGSAP